MSVIRRYLLTLYTMMCVISPNNGTSSSGASRTTMAPFLYSVELISSRAETNTCPIRLLDRFDSIRMLLQLFEYSFEVF